GQVVDVVTAVNEFRRLSVDEANFRVRGDDIFQTGLKRWLTHKLDPFVSVTLPGRSPAPRRGYGCRGNPRVEYTFTIPREFPSNSSGPTGSVLVVVSRLRPGAASQEKRA